MLASHLDKQLTLLAIELSRLQKKAACGTALDPYEDFEGLSTVRNSLVFLQQLVARHDFEPPECAIGTAPDGSLYPVAR